jgi:hypothetical protein
MLAVKTDQTSHRGTGEGMFHEINSFQRPAEGHLPLEAFAHL